MTTSITVNCQRSTKPARRYRPSLAQITWAAASISSLDGLRKDLAYERSLKRPHQTRCRMLAEAVQALETRQTRLAEIDVMLDYTRKTITPERAREYLELAEHFLLLRPDRRGAQEISREEALRAIAPWPQVYAYTVNGTIWIGNAVESEVAA